MPEVPAAARAIEAGAAALLWVSIAGDEHGEKDMSKSTWIALAATIDAEPVLRDIPIAPVQTDAAAVALACLLSGAWGRLALAFPPTAGDLK